MMYRISTVSGWFSMEGQEKIIIYYLLSAQGTQRVDSGISMILP